MIVHPSHAKQAPRPGGANSIVRERRAGMEISICEHSRLRELHLTVRALPGESLPQLLRRLTAVLKEYDATIVRQEIFGALCQHAAGMQLLEELFGGVAWPLTWIEGAAADGGICGTHVFAIAGTSIQPLAIDGKAVGVIFNDRSARHCILGNVVPSNSGESPAAQTEEVYRLIEQSLASAGMIVADIVRTWFFMDHILDWYGDFNRVRNTFYKHQNPRPQSFPASTGISGKNPQGAALSVGLWAMQPLDAQSRFGEVLSPLQCPAPEYGSGFSRAAEIVTPDYRRIFVSGTASIHPGGASAHPNDIDAQVDLTMQVVDAILRSRNLSFVDVTRATLYFKDIAQAPSFAAWCAKHNLSAFPAIATEAHVCRDELLFEIELDALSVTAV